MQARKRKYNVWPGGLLVFLKKSVYSLLYYQRQMSFIPQLVREDQSSIA